MTDKDILAEAIVKKQWYMEGRYTLSSGKESKYYIDLRPAILDSRHVCTILVPLTQVIAPRIQTGGIVLCGVTMSGVPLVGSLLHRLSNVVREVRSIVVRPTERMHGTRHQIEGIVRNGDRVIVIDDVATSGQSIAKTVSVLRANYHTVEEAIVVVDREEGAAEWLKKHYDVTLRHVITIRDIQKAKERLSGQN